VEKPLQNSRLCIRFWHCATFIERMKYVCNVTFSLLITIYAPDLYGPMRKVFDAGRYIKVSSQRLIIEMYSVRHTGISRVPELEPVS